MEDRHKILKWARLLEDEAVTLQEGQLFALISVNDRLLESLTALQDMQMRLERMERFIARMYHPHYDAMMQSLALEARANGVTSGGKDDAEVRRNRTGDNGHEDR